jgi:Bacterial surface proteins containing Ig-like domains
MNKENLETSVEGLQNQTENNINNNEFINNSAPNAEFILDSNNSNIIASPVTDFDAQQTQVEINSVVQSTEGLNEQQLFDLEMQAFMGEEPHEPKQFIIEPESPIQEQVSSIEPVYTDVPSIFGQGVNEPSQEELPPVQTEEAISVEEPSIGETPIINEQTPAQPIESTIQKQAVMPEFVPTNLNQNDQTNNENNLFQYDFADETKEQVAAPIETETKLDDNLMHFDFKAVIRDQNPKEIVPPDNRVELTKLLEPKENIIKKESEAGPEDNNVIHINDDEGKDYRRKKAFMKASLYAFYVFIVFFGSVFAYTIYQQQSAFTLSRKEISLALSSTYQAEVIMNTNIQDNLNYEWSSSDPRIATVTETGVITALNDGKTTITVKSKKTRKTKELVVNTIFIDVNSIRFNKNKLTMTTGEKSTLSPIINDDSTIIIDLVWESSNPDVVSVDLNGHISAIGEGTATILAIEEVSGLAAEIEITVKAKKAVSNSNSNSNSNINKKVAVNSISLNKSSATITVGDSVTINATVRPANATNKKIAWSSSNTAIATVNANGKITAKKAGTAIITAKTNDGNKTATIKITVEEKKPAIISVTGITLSKTNLSIEAGKSSTLTYTIAPTNATNQEVSWSSSNTAVATVDSNGKITAKAEGNATITVTTKDGSKTATCSVVVTKAEPTTVSVTEITLDKTTLTLDVGEFKTLVPTIKPGNATNKAVTWSSSDTSVATVDSNGKVTAKSEGTTTITVTTKDGNKKDTCVVTVNALQDDGEDEG